MHFALYIACLTGALNGLLAGALTDLLTDLLTGGVIALFSTVTSPAQSLPARGG